MRTTCKGDGKSAKQEGGWETVDKAKVPIAKILT